MKSIHNRNLKKEKRSRKDRQTGRKQRSKSECLGVVISSKKTIVHKFNYTSMSLVKSKLFPWHSQVRSCIFA